MGLTDRGKSLLYALMRQIDGRNNGRLQLTNKWLAEHGWQSNSSNAKAIKELTERELIVTTRFGGLNAGCNWYAVTWLSISNFVGLDVSAQTYRQGAWADCKLPPTERRKPPQTREKPSVHRNSAIPASRTERQSAIPTTETKTAILTFPASPVYGNNVSIPYTPPETSKGKKRIVGKPRKERAH